MHRPVETVLEDAEWETLGLDDMAQSAARCTLAHLGLDPTDFAITLLGCDDARIAVLNGDFRGVARPTNVLSWPSAERGARAAGAVPDLPALQGDAPLELGDVAIARATCIREAEAAGVAMSDHISHLLVHAVLHLLGFDHVRDRDATLMERLEVEILTGMGIATPYATTFTDKAPRGPV